jgi:hypothetical protein
MLIVNEKPTWHASHWKVTEDSIKRAFAAQSAIREK